MHRLTTAAIGLGLLGTAAAPLAAAGSGGARAAAAAPPATAAAARCRRTITGPGGGLKTITLVDHTCATVRLGGGLAWSVPRSSSSRVRVTGGPAAGSWYLTAAATGTATITATGRPRCAAGRACPAFIVLFSLRVRVVARRR
ncbi:MAG: hypothetical protein LC745_11595 [Planctomycetia bacterium]|nr:hypothetical protein [Planctomycetia bacterium]